ncbi:MAG: carboxypeptidase regulatory-like domain-containing protein [FCB group bacterium]|nr:carboxypeptidase regulatory-like domain-containing protein [FCB group bacterium]
MRLLDSTSWTLPRWALILLILITAEIGFSASTLTLRGSVTDSDNESIVGASIILYAGDSLITGQATDLEGLFALKISDISSEALTFRISAVGFLSRQLSINDFNNDWFASTTLERKPVRLDAINVSPVRVRSISTFSISQNKIRSASRYSLVPTNPVSAIVQPQVVRQGSIHSSKIRVSGTSPKYYLNDIDIGQDPAHYGMFLIVPGSVIENLDFHAKGTPAKFGLPTVVELETPQPFGQSPTGEINLSAVEATGAWQVGGDHTYALATLRKSVLDKLIKQFEMQTDRRTIPPVNFQDVFLSTGWMPSKNLRILFEQYHSRDYLAYSTASTNLNPNGIKTSQSTSQQYYSLRLLAASQNLMLKMRGAYNRIGEFYYAKVNGSENGLNIDLEANRQLAVGGAEVTLFAEGAEVVLGQEFHFLFDRRIDMNQRGWNFMAPDATSDNPHPYKFELNQIYDDFHLQDAETDGAGYLSIKLPGHRFEIEGGIRLQYFGRLAENWKTLYRGSIATQLGGNTRLELFAGTFAENPSGNILESYQIIIHDNLHRLLPIESRLASLKLSFGPVTLGIFGKQTNYLPVTGPNFEKLDENSQPLDGFITVRSEGKIKFVGGDIAFKAEDLLLSNLNLNAYYSFSQADKKVESIDIPYELNAPHTFYTRTDYRLSKVVTIGSVLSFRSGYAYTPNYSAELLSSHERMNETYYNSVLSRENSLRFSSHVSLDLRLKLDFGRTEMFVGVSNITNEDNPIINSSSGYIYDSGLLPGIGFTHTF